MNETGRAIEGLGEYRYGFDLLVISVAMLGWLGVTVVAIVLTFRSRRRPGHERGRSFRAPLWLEATWQAGLLGLFILWWVVGGRRYVRIQRAPDDAMAVYVTGKQWMWQLAYADGRSSIGVLTVPAGKNVKLLMTSRDVIHSFNVPSFRLARDVLPGRYTTLWFQGVEVGSYQTFYAPYGSRSPTAAVPTAAGVFVLWLASIITGANFIATTHTDCTGRRHLPWEWARTRSSWARSIRWCGSAAAWPSRSRCAF